MVPTPSALPHDQEATMPNTPSSASAAQPPTAARDTGLVAALLILSVSTGILDGVSYHALDQVFTGNMTGNVLFVGFALGGQQELPVINLLVALLAFVLGVIVAARVLRIRPTRDRVPRATTVMLACGTAATLAIGVGWGWIEPLDSTGILLVTGVLAFFLGAQASALKPVGIRDISTVVVTMTIVNLASDGWFVGKNDPHWLRKLLAILAMALGAYVGAALYFSFGAAVATCAGGVVMGCGAVVLRVVSNRLARSGIRQSRI
ncbi:DUF1275 domain-containing protein [Mycetocola zhujimingii]|nr:DUF1275 domain-containing protein [Mycetocola zhujimingii]